MTSHTSLGSKCPLMVNSRRTTVGLAIHRLREECKHWCCGPTCEFLAQVMFYYGLGLGLSHLYHYLIYIYSSGKPNECKVNLYYNRIMMSYNLEQFVYEIKQKSILY